MLVTCSTLFQNDRRLAEIACEAFADEPFEVVVTTADVDASGLKPRPNIRIERFVPHTPVLERAACVVCHAGMGITQKALAHGVPVVAVPFGRDQPEVARRVEVAGARVRLPRRRLDAARLHAAVRSAIELQPGTARIAAAFERGGTAREAEARMTGSVRPDHSAREEPDALAPGDAAWRRRPAPPPARTPCRQPVLPSARQNRAAR